MLVAPVLSVQSAAARPALYRHSDPRPGRFRPLPPLAPALPDARWTEADVRKVTGLPAAMLFALVPDGYDSDGYLYNAAKIATGLTAVAELRAERRNTPREERPLPPAPVGSRRHRREVRDSLFATDRRCRYCGRGIRRRSEATLDHMVPVSRGGSDAASNLTLSCQRCNVAKDDRTPEEWAAAILAARPAVEPAEPLRTLADVTAIPR